MHEDVAAVLRDCLFRITEKVFSILEAPLHIFPYVVVDDFDVVFEMLGRAVKEV